MALINTQEWALIIHIKDDYFKYVCWRWPNQSVAKLGFTEKSVRLQRPQFSTLLLLIMLLTGGNTTYKKAHILEKRKKIIKLLRQGRITEKTVLTTISRTELEMFKQAHGRWFWRQGKQQVLETKPINYMKIWETLGTRKYSCCQTQTIKPLQRFAIWQSLKEWLQIEQCFKQKQSTFFFFFYTPKKYAKCKGGRQKKIWGL